MDARREMKEPLAIVGIGCRFPGAADSPEAFWRLLLDKRDAVRPVPKSRWDWRQFCDADPEKAGKAYNFEGGFLEEDVEQFDPLFFGISPREARIMDPQQRLLLETAWEAFEDAGLTREALAGSQTGVFVGGFWLDHQINQFGSLNIDSMNTHSPMSATLTLLSNRLSYVFDLRGPSLTLDTACSSSLVAAHYACHSIWSGESAMALVGGANVMTSPSNSIGLSKGKFLADHSRCMTFDQRASGYARGEGAAVAVIMPWSAAKAGGYPVYALIRATGVNQDGQTPGITMPNPEAQKALMRKVYAEAGVAAAEIQYIEAHGTGTQAGDLAESQALHAVLSEGRRGRVLVGSVKTNLGHLEAAAGMAGLIKAALCLKHGKIPANLHFEQPNPQIPFGENCLEVPTALRDWPAGERRFAGINSFGYGGTNAHLLLEAAPGEPQPAPKLKPRCAPALVPLSAQNESGLKAAAGRLAARLESGPVNFEDLLHTLCRRRSHLDLRSYAVAADPEQLRTELEKISRGLGPELAPVVDSPQGLVFVFTGMGPQWWGMGQTLYARFPEFQKTLDACDAVFRKLAGWSVLEAMLASESESRMSETRIAQPANFLLQAGLTNLLASWGVRPAAIIGHSVGEVAAAWAAGALTLSDAVRVSYHRSRLQQTLAGGNGGMLAVNLSEAETTALFEELGLGLSIAAVNAWNSVTISGDTAEIERLSRHLTQLARFNRPLQVEIAYHSRHMDPIREEFVQALAGLQPQAAAIPLYSTVTGRRAGGGELGPEYWWQNVRQPVRFQAGIQALLGAGHDQFLEVGPHPVLAQSIQAEGLRQKKEIRLAATLNRKLPEPETFLGALGSLFQWGWKLAWQTQLAPDAAFVRLPGYPWQRERYWYELEALREYKLGRQGHVLLNRTAPGPDPAWEVELNAHYLPFLPDHCIGSAVVVPGALYVEAGLAARQELAPGYPCSLEQIRFHQVCSLNPDQVQRLHTRYRRSTGEIEVFSTHKDEGAAWIHHATLGLNAAAAPDRPAALDWETLAAQCPEPVDAEAFYRMLGERSLHYGPYFKPITKIRRGPRQALLEIGPAVQPADGDGYLFGPTILDALFQALIVASQDADNDPETKTFIPVAIERVTLFAAVAAPCRGITRLVSKSDRSLKGEALLFAADGSVIAEVAGITCQHLAQSRDEDAVQPEWFYEWVWQNEPRPTAIRPQGETWLLADDYSGLADALSEQLHIRGVNTVVFRPGDSPEALLQRLEESRIRHAVFLLATPSAEPEIAHMRSGCRLMTEVLQNGFAEREATTWSVVSRGVHSLAHPNPEAAPAWGLARVARNEYPHLRCRLIDCDLDPNTLAASLAEELLTEPSNEEIALGPSGRRVHRLQRMAGMASPEESRPVSADQPLALAMSGEGLRFQHLKRRRPAAGEVEIKVAAALATRLPGLEGSLREGRLWEYAGVVEEVGEGVADWKKGDPVAVLHPAAFATYLRVPAAALCRSASPVSLAWVVAGHVLLASGRPERVLLVRGANALGFAAAEIGKRLAVQVIAVCGEAQEKLVYADRGIVACLAGELAPQSADMLIACGSPVPEAVVAALKPFGRLVLAGAEPGLPAGLAAMLARKHCTLSFLNLRSLLEEDPAGLARMAQTALAHEALRNDPSHQPVPLARMPEVLASLQDPAAAPAALFAVADRVTVVQPQQAGRVQSGGSYLVTGGTGGFGLEVGRWLAGQGAGEVILASRSGGNRPEAQAAAAELRRNGCRVTLLAVDIADSGSVDAMMAAIREGSLPLKGIVHSAMVLDDAYLRALTPERMDAVLAPKVRGALLLERATRGLDLDFFAVFSSVSAVIGNPGQANYAAANAFLDGFAHWLQANGRKATAVNWGVLSESGVVARQRQVAALLARPGIKGFSNRQALNALGRVLAAGTPQVGVFDVDWPVWLEQNPAAAGLPALGKLVSARRALNPKVERLITALRPMGQEERLAAIEQQIAGVISQVVKIPEKTIQRNQNIMNYGVDSLMALDLARSLKADLGLELSMMELMNGPSVGQLARRLLDHLEGHWNGQLLDQVDGMSEAELDALLAGELGAAN